MQSSAKYFQEHKGQLSPSDEKRIKLNYRSVFSLVESAAVDKTPITKELLSEWHSSLFTGLTYVPHPCYLGGYRGSDSHPWLKTYQTFNRNIPAIQPNLVAEAVDKLILEINRVTAKTPEQIIASAASIYTQWVYIYPFCNGNARMSRLITDYILMKFGLPSVLGFGVRPPRPNWGGSSTNPLNHVKSQMTKFILSHLISKK